MKIFNFSSVLYTLVAGSKKYETMKMSIYIQYMRIYIFYDRHSAMRLPLIFTAQLIQRPAIRESVFGVYTLMDA